MDKLLEGYGILCTAVHSRERDDLARQVVQWGGEFLSTFSVKDPPHLIITRSVRSPKYRALLRAHPHILAVTPEWLFSCAQAGGAAAALLHWGLLLLAVLCSCCLGHAERVFAQHRYIDRPEQQQRQPEGRARPPPPTAGHPPTQPLCCAACLQAGRLLPYDSFRVGTFHGLTICFSGLSAGKKTAMAASVCRAGGQHSAALDKRCTHLVTNSTDSDKYRWVGGWMNGWVVHAAVNWGIVAEHQAASLLSCNHTTSQSACEQREWSICLLPQRQPCGQPCSALPCPPICRFARKEGILTVSTRWVEESLEAGWCQDEAVFEVSDDDCGGQTGGPGDAAAAAAAAAAAVRRSAPLPAAAAPSALLVEETTRLSDLAPDGSMGVPGIPPTESTGGDAPPSGLPPPQPLPQQQRGPSRLQHAASLSDAATSRLAAATATQKQKQQQAPDPQHQQYQQLALPAAPAHAVARRQAAQLEAQLEQQLNWDDGTPTFLDAVRLRLLGCTPLESRKCLGLVRQGAAKRYADWRDDINHVVVSRGRLALLVLNSRAEWGVRVLVLAACILWRPLPWQALVGPYRCCCCCRWFCLILLACPCLQVGSDLGTVEAGDALDFLSTHRSCHLVNLDWLRQVSRVGGGRQQSRYCANGGIRLPASRLWQRQEREQSAC
jgi:hypothetical protein